MFCQSRTANPNPGRLIDCTKAKEVLAAHETKMEKFKAKLERAVQFFFTRDTKEAKCEVVARQHFDNNDVGWFNVYAFEKLYEFCAAQ